MFISFVAEIHTCMGLKIVMGILITRICILEVEVSDEYMYDLF